MRESRATRAQIGYDARAATSGRRAKPLRKIVIWDAPTRLFHWLAAALVVAAYVTWRLNWMHWHVYIGDALLALVLFRLAWGFFGSETARFSNFIASPLAAFRYLAKALHPDADQQGNADVGHNPAGGWMVLLLLLLLLAETLTGLFVNNDVADVGPFTALAPAWVDNLVTDLHGILWQVLLAAIVLHLLAVAFYWAVKRQNLVLPMIVGRKALPTTVQPPAMTPPSRALLLFACGVVAAAACANFL
jgi:cytochrome b